MKIGKFKIILSLLGVGLVVVGLFGFNLPADHSLEMSTGRHETATHGLVKDENFHPTKALAALREKVTLRPEEMVNCHMETHMIGHAAYAAFGEAAYAFADPMCGGGYLHGVLEQAFKANGVGYLDSIVHSVCDGEIAESCLHGVGHGLHEALNDVKLAIALCDSIVSAHSDCYDGVFMDAFDSEGMVTQQTLEIETALALCESVDSTAQASCYFYLPRLLGHLPYLDTVALCSSAGIKTGWAACAQGSGVYFMKWTSGFSSDRANQFCAAYLDKNQRELCQQGVIAYEQYGAAGNNRWH